MWLGGAVALASPECESQVVEAPEASESWRCFYLWARRSGTWDAAHARLARAVAEDADNAHAMINLGHIEMSTGQAAPGDWYARALAAYTGQSDLEGVVKANVAFAQLLSSRGGSAEAVYGHLDAADAAARASGVGLLQAIVDAQRARRLWRDGSDYAEAYRLIRNAELHAFPDGPYQLRLVVLHVLAGICQETGRLDEAAAASGRMVALTAAAGDRYVEATARLNVAAFALMNPDKVAPGTAERESALALEAAEEVGNPYILAGANCMRAEVLEAAGGDSLPLWLACRDRYAALGESGMAASGALGAAATMVDDQPEQALALTAEAVKTTAETGDVWAEVLARFVDAVLVWEVRGTEAGIAAFADHHAASERLLAEQADADTRAAVLANQVDGHHHLAARLAHLGADHLDGAIAAIERLRARELRDALKEGLVLPEADPETAARLADIGVRLTELNTLLGAASDETAQQALDREREALEAEESRLRDQLLDRDVSASAPTLAELQAELNQGEVLVAYQTPPVLTQYPHLGARPWVLAVSRDAVGVVELPDRRSLESLVLTFGGLFEDEGAGAAARERAGAAVFAQVLGPALDAVGGEGGKGQAVERTVDDRLARPAASGGTRHGGARRRGRAHLAHRGGACAARPACSGRRSPCRGPAARRGGLRWRCRPGGRPARWGGGRPGPAPCGCPRPRGWRGRTTTCAGALRGGGPRRPARGPRGPAARPAGLGGGAVGLSGRRWTGAGGRRARRPVPRLLDGRRARGGGQPVARAR